MLKITTKFDETTAHLRTLRRVLPLLVRAAPLEVSALAFTLLVGGLVPALTVLLTKATVDGLVRLTRDGEANLVLLTALWAAALLVGQATALVSTVIQGLVADRFTLLINTRLMLRTRDLPGLDLVEDPAFHDDIEVLQQGAAFRPMNLLSTLIYMARDLVTVAGLVVALLTVGWWVPLALLLGTVPLARAQIRLHELGWSLTVRRSPDARELRYDSLVAVRPEHAKEVRLYDLVPWLVERYGRRATAMHAEMRRLRAKQALGVMPASLLLTAIAAVVFAVIVRDAALGLLTAGSVVLVVQGLTQMRASLNESMSYVGLLTEHLLYFRRFFAFLDASPRVARPANPLPLPATSDLTLANVTFRYPDGRAALDDVTLHVPQGQVVAIVGENGAGKSTLVKLLLRYYDPTEGHVRIGGTDLRHLDPDAWRARVGAVFQDFSRFEYTVRENIELARHDAPDAGRLAHAVTQAGFDPAVTDLPEGLDTRLGRSFGGTDLSGGQWQKLATARALYRDASVLILDEPTAALDPRSEHEVYARFADLARGRTALLITHRLASVRMADRVLVLKHGRIVEDGTHASLLARGGEYAELWRLQAEKYVGEVA